jgi:Leucine-rich repeat (LRR) protein
MEMEEKRIKEEPSVVAISSDLITNAAGSASHSEIETLHLSLRTCKIRRIENLGGLSNLRELNLSYNLISNIEGLDGLRTLVDLNLSENKITHIENLTALVSLEDLNLSGNRIAHIPKPEFEPL